jgi:hypothetical protein
VGRKGTFSKRGSSSNSFHTLTRLLTTFALLCYTHGQAIPPAEQPLALPIPFRLLPDQCHRSEPSPVNTALKGLYERWGRMRRVGECWGGEGQRHPEGLPARSNVLNWREWEGRPTGWSEGAASAYKQRRRTRSTPAGSLAFIRRTTDAPTREGSDDLVFLSSSPGRSRLNWTFARSCCTLSLLRRSIAPSRPSASMLACDTLDCSLVFPRSLSR